MFMPLIRLIRFLINSFGGLRLIKTKITNPLGINIVTTLLREVWVAKLLKILSVSSLINFGGGLEKGNLFRLTFARKV